jgi:hypothetical protein
MRAAARLALAVGTVLGVRWLARQPGRWLANGLAGQAAEAQTWLAQQPVDPTTNGHQR